MLLASIEPGTSHMLSPRSIDWAIASIGWTAISHATPHAMDGRACAHITVKYSCLLILSTVYGKHYAIDETGACLWRSGCRSTSQTSRAWPSNHTLVQLTSWCVRQRWRHRRRCPEVRQVRRTVSADLGHVTLCVPRCRSSGHPISVPTVLLVRAILTFNFSCNQ